MRNSCRSALAVLALAVLALAVLALAPAARAQLSYSIEELPTPPGTFGAKAYGVDGLGRAVGVASDALGQHAILWSGGTSVTLPPPPVGTWPFVWAHGVSAHGVIGGALDSIGIHQVAIRWTGGVATALPIPPGGVSVSAFAIADNGTVVGAFQDTGGMVHACRWSSTDVFQALPEPVGALDSTAVSIRADGTVLGWYTVGFSSSRGICAWTPAGQVSVLVPPGSYALVPAAMAADGSVYGTNVGQIGSWPFRAVGGVVSFLPTLTPPGQTGFTAILDADASGRAIGRSFTGSRDAAALWNGSNVFDLRSLVLGAEGWMLDSATGIDDSGTICGWGSRNGVQTAFLLRPAVFGSYCTAGTSSGGCVPVLSASGTPSASAASGFVLGASGVDAQRTGLVFYGLSGCVAAPWGTGTSFLCVKAPTQRTPPSSTAGTQGQCDGALSLDWNAFMTGHPGALGNPRVSGARVQAQAWYRDPAGTRTTVLSSAVEFVLAP